MTLLEIPNIEIPIKPENDIRQLTNVIVSTGNTLLREAGRLFKPHGLSAAQFNVLNLLTEAGPEGLRPSDLTYALVVDPSSITYLLDRMEEAKWLRRADDADRRAWRILLTPAGRELHARVAPLYFGALQQIVRGFDTAKVGPLVRALGEIRAAAHAAVDSMLARTPPPARRGRRRALAQADAKT